MLKENKSDNLQIPPPPIEQAGFLVEPDEEPQCLDPDGFSGYLSIKEGFEDA